MLLIKRGHDISNIGKIGLVLAILAGALLTTAIALADCNIQSSSGSDDIVVCANPADPNGIATGYGDDTVTVNADTSVTGNSRAIDTGGGSDTVYQHGTIHAGTAGVFLDKGNDTLFNYGTIYSQDYAARCFPESYHTCTINNYNLMDVVGEAIDIINNGGHVIVYNSGRVQSAEQEAVHAHGSGTTEVTNTGTMTTRRQSIEVYGGTGIIVNNGTATSVTWPTIDLDAGNDQVTNRGTLRCDIGPTIKTDGGNDTIRHYGNATSRNSGGGGGVIDAGPGSDTILVQGNLTETGGGYAAVKAGSGSDTVIIAGGSLNRLVDGGSDSDTLIFRFTGSQSEIDTFRSAMAGKSPSSGSVYWRGLRYEWKGFEQIKLELTTG